MRSSLLAASLVLVTALAIAGCSSVSTTVPLGEPIDAAQAKKFVGIWLTPKDDPISIRHVAGNELRLGGMEWKDNAHQVVEMTVHVTQDEGQMFVNLQGKETADYSFMRVAFSEDSMMNLKGVNVEAFAEAVEQGKISGTVDRNKHVTTVKLTPSEGELADFVSPQNAADQFTFDDVLVLRRLKSFEEAQKQSARLEPPGRNVR